MTHEEFEKRKERAVRETLIIKKTEEGYRVYSPANPTKIYLVSGGLDRPSCSCPDFETHKADPEWRCKHVLAVLNRLGGPAAGREDAAAEREERLAIQEEGRLPDRGELMNSGNGTSQMVLKRSVSPDGRIDSLSVEFSCPVEGSAAQDIKSRAGKTLKLQSEIVGEFLARNGKGDARPDRAETDGNGATKARMLDVAGMHTRFGRRLFINVQVNGEILKFFGSKKQLGEAIEAAGFPNLADRVHEGMDLNVPCRVTTKRSDDGRYTNIDEVFPDRSRKSPGARP